MGIQDVFDRISHPLGVPKDEPDRMADLCAECVAWVDPQRVFHRGNGCGWSPVQPNTQGFHPQLFAREGRLAAFGDRMGLLCHRDQLTPTHHQGK